MRSGINFNSPDGSASISRPGDTGRLTENKSGSGYGDSILDDLFSDDDNSSSGRSDVSARGSNNLSGNSNQSVGNDYNPLLDDDDDDVNTPEKTVGSYRSASNSSGTGAHSASVSRTLATTSQVLVCLVILYISQSSQTVFHVEPCSVKTCRQKVLPQNVPLSEDQMLSIPIADTTL